MRRASLLALALAACSSAPPLPPAAPEPPPSAAAPATTLAPAPSSAPHSSPAPTPTVDDDGKGTPLPASLEGAKLPPAPCFAPRVYRGTIGKDALTLRLAPAASRLAGLLHYDLPGPGLEVTGQVTGSAFTLDEKGAGRFRGTCDAATGRLTGEYELRGKKTAFTLHPRPEGEAPLHATGERARVTSPVPPHCARLGKTKETQMVKEGPCLPTDPAALAALQAETGAGLCTFELATPRVFGLATPAAEAAANAALTHDPYGYAAPSVRASVQRCPAGGEVKAGGGYSVLHNADDVLTVTFSGYISEANAAHAALFGPEPVVVDLRAGRRLALGDLVSDVGAFRAAILACDEGNREDLEWDEKSEIRKAPRWVVVPGGIAVIVGPVAPVKNGLQGRGPIASFAALAARGLLRADSPVARLWAGVKPAPKGAPFCEAMLGSGEILAVRQRPAAP